MDVTLWIIRGPLAFAFIAVGTMKLFAYEKFKSPIREEGTNRHHTRPRGPHWRR